MFFIHSKILRIEEEKKIILGEEKKILSIANYINITNKKNSIENNSVNKVSKISQIKINKIKKYKTKKKYGKAKNKKSIFIDNSKQYNKKIYIISFHIHKFIITKGELKDSREKNSNNISINNNTNIINININNESKIFLSNI